MSKIKKTLLIGTWIWLLLLTATIQSTTMGLLDSGAHTSPGAIQFWLKTWAQQKPIQKLKTSRPLTWITGKESKPLPNQDKILAKPNTYWGRFLANQRVLICLVHLIYLICYYHFYYQYRYRYFFLLSAADVKMEIPVLMRSLKSSILSSTSFQMAKTFWWVVSNLGA